MCFANLYLRQMIVPVSAGMNLNCSVNVNKLPAVSTHLNNAVSSINIMMLVIRKQHANHYGIPQMIQRQSQ